MMALMPICIGNECMEAVQETCQEVIIENNEQLLQTMEGMVANSTCDASNFVFDDQMKNDLMLRLSDEFKEEIKIQIADELREDFKAELLPEIKSTVRVELKAEFRYEFKEEFMNEMKSEIKTELKEEMREDVKNELKVEVKSELKEELGEALKEEFEDNASKMANLLMGFMTKITNFNFVSTEDIVEIKSEIKQEVVEELTSTFSDDDDLPTDSVTDEASTTGNIQLNEDQQDNQDKVRYFKLAKTCQELAYNEIDESGEYEVDPDGHMNGEGPIRVFCDFTTNSTVIRHNLGNEVSLENHYLSGPETASVEISYDAHMDQIVSLLNNPTSHCKQEILFSCNIAPLVIENHPLALFKYRNGANTRDITCADSTTSCNCNSKSPERLQDTIVITDKRLLPVTGFTYGPFTNQNAQAAVEIKSLECEHYGITRNDCNSIKFLTSSRLQFDMEYVDNKDCYVEVYLKTQANLKLTVSNFKVRQIYKLK